MVSDIYNSKSINRGKNIVELEFSGIEYLKLFPYDEEYTCEILGVTLILEDGKIFWCDCDGISKEEFQITGEFQFARRNLGGAG